MKRALLGVLFALAAWSPRAFAAGVPILLPVGESPADWAEVLAARGLEVRTGSLPSTGAWVVLSDGGDHWTLRLHDWKGVDQTLNVSPCTNAQEREDLLFLVSTMLGKAPDPDPVAIVPVPVPVPVGPAPTLPTQPPKTTAVTTQASTTPPTTTPATTTTPAKTATPATTATTKTTPKVEPTKTPPAATTKVEPTKTPAAGRTGLWLSAGGGVGIRPEAGVAGDIRVDGGWHVLPSVRIGLGVAFRTPAALPSTGDERVMNDLDVVVEGAWVSQGTIAPYAGAYFGLASRSFTDAGAEVNAGALPIVGAEGGVIIPLGALPLSLAPSARVQADLRQIDLVSASGTSRLSPVEVRAGLMLVYRPG